MRVKLHHARRFARREESREKQKEMMMKKQLSLFGDLALRDARNAYQPAVKDLPLEEQPVERMYQNNPGALSTTEILAILLGTSHALPPGCGDNEKNRRCRGHVRYRSPRSHGYRCSPFRQYARAWPGVVDMTCDEHAEEQFELVCDCFSRQMEVHHATTNDRSYRWARRFPQPG